MYIMYHTCQTEEFYKPLSSLLMAALLVLEIVMQKKILMTVFMLALSIENINTHGGFCAIASVCLLSPFLGFHGGIVPCSKCYFLVAAY